MNTRNLLLVFLLFALSKQEVYSQFGFSHELGVIVGPVAFYSDYGVRNDFETNSGNVGFGIGIIHYINFSYRADCNCYTRDRYFNDHFKIRTEIDYHKTRLEHFGEYVDPDETTLFSDQLRAVTGSTRVLDIGSQLEYFPLSIRDFAAGGYKIAPFISAGVHWVNFDPEAESTLGPLNSPLASSEKYRNAYQQEGDSTWSIVFSVGARYKLTPVSDLMIDSRWQYYFSNWVDGLNPDVPENKANDWIYWLNIGYVHYLD
jgi:hypothetical protein